MRSSKAEPTHFRRAIGRADASTRLRGDRRSDLDRLAQAGIADRVAAAAALEKVVTGRGDEEIVAVAADEMLIGVGADQDVGAVGAQDLQADHAGGRQALDIIVAGGRDQERIVAVGAAGLDEIDAGRGRGEGEVGPGLGEQGAVGVADREPDARAVVLQLVGEAGNELDREPVGIGEVFRNAEADAADDLAGGPGMVGEIVGDGRGGERVAARRTSRTRPR